MCVLLWYVCDRYVSDISAYHIYDEIYMITTIKNKETMNLSESK